MDGSGQEYDFEARVIVAFPPEICLLRHLGFLWTQEDKCEVEENFTEKIRGWVKELFMTPGITARKIVNAFSENGWTMDDEDLKYIFPLRPDVSLN